MPGRRTVRRSARSGRSRWPAVLVLLAAVVLAGGVMLLPEATSAEPRSATGLSSAAESTRVEELQAKLPQADGSAALLVFNRTDGRPLSTTDQDGAREAAERARAAAGGEALAPPQLSEDGTVALLVLPLPATDEATAEAGTDQPVDRIREAVRQNLPSGVQANVTGPAAFGTDLARVFDGADLRLLVVTAAVVAILLLLTYRSPGLVLIPLVVVGLTEQLTRVLSEQVLALVGLPGGGQVTGITSVLVFGAATDYALLLIARYREQLRTTDDARLALRTAVRRVTEPVLASGGTVVFALVILLLASTETLRGIAVTCILGIVLAMASGLLVLPAALALAGRRIFWPFVPRVGEQGRDGRVWSRLGTLVARRVPVVLVASVLVLGALALGGLGVRTGLAQNDQFRVEPEAVRGGKILAQAFPAGTTNPPS